MTVNIRLAAEHEIEEIINLQTLSITELSQQKYNEDQIAVLVKMQDGGRRRGLETRLIAELENGSIVGFAALSDYNCYITGLYVHPDFVRQGIGTRLLQAIEKLALRRNHRVLKVISSLVASDLYRKNNFSLIRSYQLVAEGNIKIPSKLFEKELIPLSQIEENRNLAAFICLCMILVFSLIISLLYVAEPDFDNKSRLSSQKWP